MQTCKKKKHVCTYPNADRYCKYITRKSVDGEPSHIPALILDLRTITYVSFSFLAPKT